ncbi:MAG TPA: CARDB domain-containing protein [Bacteroidales bacterium]|nr:CARDB domain-containing protein [Bacteroidales bacterium]HSA43118.1 CARDB domain-containing protein [Bacteroidales bacterium]
MKKISATLLSGTWPAGLLLFVLLMASPARLSAQADLFIRIDTVTASPGDSILIPVYAQQLNNAGSFTFFIQYSTSVLKFGRALNWNPLLTEGVNLANASGGQVAVVWADQNGVSIADDKLFDLKFKYVSGSTALSFTGQCEITDLMGNPLPGPITYLNGYVNRKLSVSIQANPSSLCFGDTTFLSFTTTGGFGNVTWLWSSDPPGFNSTLSNPWDVPSNSLTYHIMATDGFDTAYQSTAVTVYFFQTPTPVDNMTPADGAANLNLPLLFTWSPAMAASHYDLYVWELGNPEPTTPLVSNITQISLLLSYFLEYGKSYSWRIVSKNPCIQTPGPVQTFSVRYLPDLVVSEVTVPSQAYSGQLINFSFQILNQGQGSTQTTQWSDVVYLSTDTTIDPSVDYYIGSYPNLSYLNPQEAYTQQAAFTLPQGISGNYYVIVWTDKDGILAETNNNNNKNRNQDTMYVFLSPVPDLRVAKIIVQNTAFSGQAVSVTWSVKNHGLASTGNVTWSDRVYFSNQSEPGSGMVNLGTYQRSGDLAPDSLYEMTRTVYIPNYIYGRYYLIITTDIYNQVYEHALENNNTLTSDSITVFLTPPPDLVTTSVIAPNSASVRQTLIIQYTVQNQGANVAIRSWHDRVYLSNSLTLNTNTAFMLEDVYVNKSLMPDSSYTKQASVTIPSNISGPYYFFVFSDATQKVFEHLSEENNILRCTHATEILNPDLLPSGIEQPDSLQSGSYLLFSYYEKNNGPGLLIGNWTDRIYLSHLAFFNPDSSVILATKAISNTILQPGDSLFQSLLLTVPDGIQGDFYIYVVSDIHNTIFEGSGETNNTARTPDSFYVSLTPWPDLVGTVLELPDTLTAGFLYTVQYTVQNAGPGILQGKTWKEQFIFSKNPDVPGTSYFTTSCTDTVILLPDSSFSRMITGVLPSSFPAGNYYVWMKLDAESNVYEHNGENNNLLRSDLFYIKPYPPVDLVADSLSAPDTCYSGQFIPLAWWATNQGTVPTNYHWVDGCYLSEDTVYSANDLFIYQLGHYGTLYPGESCGHASSVMIPNGMTGDYYLFIRIDRFNSNTDGNPANNVCMPRKADGTPQPIHLIFTPPPDLVVDEFNCPPAGITGQPLTISYTVKNEGSGITPWNPVWYDRFYLSTDFEITWHDQYLGYMSRESSLAPGDSYTDTVTLNIPNWANGNYIILMQTDATDQVYEHDNEGNNIAGQAVTLQMPPPSDLVVLQVIPPTQAQSGQAISISYTLLNQGSNPVNGQMRDLIFLSSDTIWDIGDLLFGNVEGYASIGPGATLNRTVSGTLSGLVPGDWYVIVRTDVLNNIVESDDLNNTGFGIQTLQLSVPLLPLGSWIMQAMPDYTMTYYRIEIPDSLAGETLFLQLKGDSVYGINELYISFENLPNRTTYDMAYGNPNAGNQEMLIPGLQTGTYYLLVYGTSSLPAPQQIQLHASILPFRIVSIDAVRGGNTGEVTLRLNGSKFTPSMSVYLTKDDEVIPGTGLIFFDQTRVFVTFDLDNADTGVYTVVADKFCDGMALLEDAFTIASGTIPDLQVNLYYPSAARPAGIVSILIEYANAGNIDLVAPEVEFKSVVSAPVSLTVSGLSQGLTSLLLPLREHNGPADVLRPGMGGTITVYSKASAGLAFTLLLPNY